MSKALKLENADLSYGNFTKEDLYKKQFLK